MQVGPRAASDRFEACFLLPAVSSAASEALTAEMYSIDVYNSTHPGSLWLHNINCVRSYVPFLATFLWRAGSRLGAATFARDAGLEALGLDG